MKRTVRIAALVLLGSCLLHGQGNAEVKPYKVSNYPSHKSSFFGSLMSGRVWVFENPEPEEFADIPHALIFDRSGKRIRCLGRRTGSGKPRWVESGPGRWEVGSTGYASIRWLDRDKKKKFVFFFYDPEDGTISHERQTKDAEGKVTWILHNVGWVQDSWPRVLADACPGIELPPGMEINEKQTSSSPRELRRQDPDAVIRRFPGSEMTGPGRVGIAVHGVPTTTRAKVWAFLNAQEGNVMLGPKGHGRVFVRGAEDAAQHEIWGLKDEGGLAWTADMVEVTDDAGEWLYWKFDGKVVARYRMGDPLPYVSTGYRHGAWQLTDRLVGGAEATALPFMGDAYADRRFVFIGDGNLSVVDIDGNLAPDEGFEGTWRWTKGRLEVRVAGDSRLHSIAWQDLARELGEKPALVTRAMLNAW